MTIGYLRYSTLHQNDVQQRFALSEYAEAHGVTIDQYISDEGVSGGVSYKNRNLNGVVKMLKDRARKMAHKDLPREKDVIIVSELSRLGRSMSDISALLNELKSIGVRLIIIKSGIDYDCANLKAQDEFLFAAMSFAAQVEKELIQSRTQSAIDARKEMIKTQGGFMSKAGKWTKRLGREKGTEAPGTGLKGGMVLHDRAIDWRKKSAGYQLVKADIALGYPYAKILEHFHQMHELAPDIYCTPTGRNLTKATLSLWAKEIRKQL